MVHDKSEGVLGNRMLRGEGDLPLKVELAHEEAALIWISVLALALSSILTSSCLILVPLLTLISISTFVLVLVLNQEVEGRAPYHRCRACHDPSR